MIVVTGLSVIFLIFSRIDGPYPDSFVSTTITPVSVTKIPVLPPVKSGPGVDCVITQRLSLTFCASGSVGRGCCCWAAIAAVRVPAVTSAVSAVARCIYSSLKVRPIIRLQRRQSPVPQRDTTSCRSVQWRPENDGTGIASAGRVTNFFMVGSDLVSWEIVTLSDGGPCRLSVVHPRGTIVEYFTTTAAAVKREQEIEALLLASVSPLPATAWAS